MTRRLFDGTQHIYTNSAKQLPLPALWPAWPSSIESSRNIAFNEAIMHSAVSLRPTTNHFFFSFSWNFLTCHATRKMVPTIYRKIHPKPHQKICVSSALNQMTAKWVNYVCCDVAVLFQKILIKLMRNQFFGKCCDINNGCCWYENYTMMIQPHIQRKRLGNLIVLWCRCVRVRANVCVCVPVNARAYMLCDSIQQLTEWICAISVILCVCVRRLIARYEFEAVMIKHGELLTGCWTKRRNAEYVLTSFAIIGARLSVCQIECYHAVVCIGAACNVCLYASWWRANATVANWIQPALRLSIHEYLFFFFVDIERRSSRLIIFNFHWYSEYSRHQSINFHERKTYRIEIEINRIEKWKCSRLKIELFWVDAHAVCTFHRTDIQIMKYMSYVSLYLYLSI